MGRKSQKAYRRQYMAARYEERKAAGVCWMCGMACSGGVRCEPCRERFNAKQREARRVREAKQVCIVCGKERRGTAAERMRWGTRNLRKDHCPRCSARARRIALRQREQARLQKNGGFADIPKMHGKRDPRCVEQLRSFTVHLDAPTQEAVLRLKAAHWEAMQQRGKPLHVGITSQVVREAIWRFEQTAGVHPTGVPVLIYPLELHVELDERAWATLTRHADNCFGGNKSACLRAMLVHAAAPKPVTAPRRRLAGWDE